MLLLDEPLAALDKKLRGETQFELKELQRKLGTTFVIVTHDQDEAMTLADRIAVMNAGKLAQVAVRSRFTRSRIRAGSRISSATCRSDRRPRCGEA